MILAECSRREVTVGREDEKENGLWAVKKLKLLATTILPLYYESNSKYRSDHCKLCIYLITLKKRCVHTQSRNQDKFSELGMRLKEQGTFVNENLIKEKRKRIQGEYNARVRSQQRSRLKLSDGRISRFEYRKKLRAYNCYGESGAADEEAISRELPNLRALIAGNYSNNVFNAEESDLFYQHGPNFTVGPNPIKSRIHKETRVSYLVCTKIDGTEKYLPMVICR